MEAYINNLKEQIELIKRVPTGMGIYSVQDGVVSKVYLNDGYYDMLGCTKEEREKFEGVATVNAVHPEDRKKVYDGVVKSLKEGKPARAVVRMYKKDNEYMYVQIDGKVADINDGVYTIYASFTNVDDHVRMQIELEKSKKTLEAALQAGHQMCCEYDPVLHTLTGQTGAHVLFNLPNVVTDFPDSLLSTDFIHPDDCKAVRDGIDKLDNGEKHVEIDARLNFKKKYRWFKFIFQKFFDKEKGYEVCICNFMDNAVQKAALDDSINHLNRIMKMNPDSIATFRMNLSKNTCGMGASRYWNILKLQDSGTVTGFFAAAEPHISDDVLRKQFHDTFSMDGLKKAYYQGQNTVALSHMYEIEDGRDEWLKTTVDMLENPETGEVEAILYTEDVNTEKIENIILQEITKKDYLQIIVQYDQAKGDIFYLYDNETNQYCVRKEHLWSKMFDSSIKLIDPKDREDNAAKYRFEYIQKQLAENNEYTVIYQRLDKPGHRFQIQYKYTGPSNKFLLITTRDITDSALLDKLKYESEHDSLTGLYNRDKIYVECDKMLKEHPYDDFVFVRLDIQKFRLYNTYFGEKEGDKLLIYIADMLRELYHTHKYGVFGRSNADVFLMCFPMREGVLEWNQEYIRKKLSNYRNDFYIAASAGIAFSDGAHKDARTMFERAILSDRSNQNKGINRISIYNEKLDKELKREQRIEHEMYQAMDQQQFVVYIQPKYTVKDEKPCGGEALVRWIHPERGLVPPSAFIPIFETNGFITELDKYMWEHVCMLLHRWREEGLDPKPISVNMSRVSMYSRNTVSFLKGLIEKYEIPAELLNLELTESAYMEEPETMKRRLMELRSEGFQIMMDDFGSAYSSLNTLREVPFDYLKLDREFLTSTDKDERGKVVIKHVAHMASELHIPVIVEGVETAEQRQLVSDIGCEYIQGFYYARPMPAEQYEKTMI